MKNPFRNFDWWCTEFWFALPLGVAIGSLLERVWPSQ